MGRNATIRESGYRYIRFDRQTRLHILEDRGTGKREGWFANKNHASAGLRFRGTDLEFATSNVK